MAKDNREEAPDGEALDEEPQEREEEKEERSSSREKQEQIISPETPEEQAESREEEAQPVKGSRLWVLTLGALGVAFGDLGTSPLYALRASFGNVGHLAPTDENVIGLLSLIFWALILLISTKYMMFVTRANNNGEGGMLALVALLNPWRKEANRYTRWLLSMGVFGTALLYGAFMLTPAISVSSAVEGITVAAPGFQAYVVPITIAILVALFLLQSRGTGTIGSLFGPIMIAWFVIQAALGISGIIHEPRVLTAINPIHGADFFFRSHWAGLAVLGGVFLVMTGGEAVYADIGHFGRRPIQLAWFSLVLPSVLLDYFGQGAGILYSHGHSIDHPFFRLAPDWALYPLVIIATVATVIASQAVISGAFSMTRQAVQLGQLPRMRLFQTSSQQSGQIYVPTLNWLLMMATIGLVLGFRSSDNLAQAYGVGLSGAMVITSILFFFVMRERWEWPRWLAGLICGLFLAADIPFFAANCLKMPHGGWFPVATAALVFTVMATWRRGRELLHERITQGEEPVPLEDFLKKLKYDAPVRVPGTAVFLTGSDSGTPPMLLHHLRHNQVLHKQALLLTVRTERVPRIPASERLEIEDLNQGIYRVFARYGFMQSPNVPVAMRLCERFDLDVDLDHTTFYVGRPTVIPTDEVPGMMLWREKIFAFMSRNAIHPTSFYNIPPENMIELGIRVEL